MLRAAPAAELTLARVRLSGREARRDVLEAALGQVRTEEIGLGSEEVLFVPRLRSRARLKAGAAGSFAAGVGADLRQLAARALRDPAGAVGDDRPLRFSSPAAFSAWLIGAVLDAPADRAEALVRAATGRPSPSSWWRADVLPSGRALVALLPRLARAGLAARWLARLEFHDIALATGSVERDYECDIVGSEPPPVAPPPSRSAAPPARRGGGADPAFARQVAAARRELAVPDPGAVSLPPPALRLLLAAEVLARAPAAPRRELAAALDEAVAMVRDQASVAAGDEPPVPLAERPRAAASPVATKPQPPVVTVLAGEPSAASACPAADPVSRLHLPVAVEPVVPPEALAKAQPALPEPVAEPPAPTAAAPPARATEQADHEALLPDPDATFDTAFGGMAFLLNAFLAMDFYPDFTRPLDRGLEIAPLALVDAVGRRWFGKRWLADPFHRWVRARGSAALPPRRWRVARGWLAPFAGRRAWHDGKTLWHEAGFPLASPVAPVAALRFARALGLRMTAPPLRRADPDWTGCLALFLAARLGKAGRIAPRDLAIPARCVATGEKLVFHFALDRLPLAIRIAGLDRDVGWLPSEGRDVRFAFA